MWPPRIRIARISIDRSSSTATLAAAPTVLRTVGWADYALLDSGAGRKLERYGCVVVDRPEPQCLWLPRHAELWSEADAVFDPSDEEDAGNWRFRAGHAPADQTLRWGEARWRAKLTPFRHLAFFPEQAANWAWLDGRARALPPGSRVLNLFGYTGVASLVCAAAGAAVTHVDASKKSVEQARDNATLSGRNDVRWIVEDARKFVAREVRRGSRYAGVILDPPKFGRGPTGEVWRLFEHLPQLVADCAALLDDDADFLLLNAYAARISGVSLAHLLREQLGARGGEIGFGELALAEDGADPREIGLSFFARWTAR